MRRLTVDTRRSLDTSLIARTIAAAMAPMKRNFTLIGVAAMLTSSALAVDAPIRAFDAKALARYDLSFARCEARFPAMQGHRDEAYLNLWRIRSDDKNATRLAGVRGGSVYKAERQLVMRSETQGAAFAASSPLERQCQGLWAEHQRVTKDKR